LLTRGARIFLTPGRRVPYSYVTATLGLKLVFTNKFCQLENGIQKQLFLHIAETHLMLEMEENHGGRSHQPTEANGRRLGNFYFFQKIRIFKYVYFSLTSSRNAYLNDCKKRADARPKACAPTCPLLRYATATLQIHPSTELKLINFNDTRMGVGKGSQGTTAPWIFIHDIDKVYG